MKTKQKLLALIVLFSVDILFHSCAVNPVTGKKQLMLMSEQQELAMGAGYDPEVLSTFGPYENKNIQSFVELKGIEMGKSSHRPNLEYHFRILDSPVVNAFAVPGGYVYLTRGILAQLNNEAELMGILGHEMGHVTARHSAQQMTKQQVAQVLLIGGMIASKQVRQFADQAMQGMQLLFLSFSRENEREADKLGVEYMSKLGYDAHCMADFFQVLKNMQMAESQNGVPTFLSTHPDPGDRYNDVNRQASEWQKAHAAPSWQINQDKYLKMIDGIVYGEDPRQGFVEGNMFYHPEMKFSYPIPVGWKTVNQPVQVQMGQPDGKAMMVFTTAKEKTLDQAASTTIQQLQLTVKDSKKTTVRGLPAVVALSEQVSQDQQTGQQNAISVMSYFIQYNNSVFVFHGISSSSDFANFARQFESTMSNFGPLTDQSKLNVMPKRILIKPVVKTGTLANALSYYKIPQAEMENLATLNNIKLTDQVEAKRLIKIIGK